MVEHRRIVIPHDDEATVKDIKRLIDGRVFSTDLVEKIRKEGEQITLVWRFEVPASAERDQFKNRSCELAGAKVCVNEVARDFRLPPSLYGTLRQIGEGANPADLDASTTHDLDWSRFVDAQFETHWLGLDHQSGDKLWCTVSVVEAKLTPKGERYLKNGYLPVS